MALAPPVSREGKGNFLTRKVARPSLAAFLPRVYGDDYPLLDHCLTLSPPQNDVRIALAGGVKVTAAKSTCSATPVLGEAIYAAKARHSAKAAERLCL